MLALSLREAVTNDDYSPVVSVLTWILLAATILSVIVKLAVKFATARSFHADDLMIFLALVWIARCYMILPVGHLLTFILFLSFSVPDRRQQPRFKP